jgi:hypothetical protein
MDLRFVGLNSPMISAFGPWFGRDALSRRDSSVSPIDFGGDYVKGDDRVLLRKKSHEGKPNITQSTSGNIHGVIVLYFKPIGIRDWQQHKQVKI